MKSTFLKSNFLPKRVQKSSIRHASGSLDAIRHTGSLKAHKRRSAGLCDRQSIDNNIGMYSHYMWRAVLRSWCHDKNSGRTVRNNRDRLPARLENECQARVESPVLVRALQSEPMRPQCSQFEGRRQLLRNASNVFPARNIRYIESNATIAGIASLACAVDLALPECDGQRR